MAENSKCYDVLYSKNIGLGGFRCRACPTGKLYKTEGWVIKHLEAKHGIKIQRELEFRPETDEAIRAESGGDTRAGTTGASGVERNTTVSVSTDTKVPEMQGRSEAKP